MTGLEDKFPKTIFAQQYIEKYGLNKAITKQLGVVTEELFEVRDACSREEYEHAMEECVDAIHAINTVLHMIPGYSAARVEEQIKQVREKNERRGYYED